MKHSRASASCHGGGSVLVQGQRGQWGLAHALLSAAGRCTDTEGLQGHRVAGRKVCSLWSHAVF